MIYKIGINLEEMEGELDSLSKKKGLSDSDTKSIKEIFDQTFNCNVWS